MTILKPVLTAQTLGSAGFGVVAGAMAMGPLLGVAAAPLLGALVLGGIGANGLIGLTWGMALVAVACALALRRGRDG
jgi:hypothetical protein